MTKQNTLGDLQDRGRHSLLSLLTVNEIVAAPAQQPRPQLSSGEGIESSFSIYSRTENKALLGFVW